MVSSSSNLPAIFLWASSWAWCSRCQLSTSAFQHPVVVPTSAIRRPSSVPLSMIEKESPSSGGEDLSEDGIRRRQLLFSLLAAATAPSAMGSFQAHAEEEIQPSILLSKIVEDWSNVDIMKPPTDDRDYVAFKLDNGLRVLLCSDPTISEAGAAMDVHVGACSDPVAVPGLAHFNEHMLFLGTKEYPQEGSFESFLSNNGGSSNAFTDSEDTVYYFSIQAESDSKYSEALKRFGSFFTSPLFTEGATGRELNAIESENAKNLQSDSFRLYQIEKSRQNPQHPHSKFFTGNKQTLLEDTKKAGLNLRNQLIEFYGKYYSANQMTLAVVGPQSTDELTRMVKDAFSNIPNKNVPPPEVEWKGIIPPYNGNSVTPNFGYAVKVVPVQDLRQVSLTWPLVYRDDQDRTDSLLAKQGTYIAHLIGHEGPDSLLSYLKRQGWVNSVTVGSEGELSDYELFQVTISLTTLGLANVYKVLEAVYSYLDLIKQKEIPKYIFEEVLQLEELGWRFSSKAAVSGTVQNLSTSMQKYPISLAVAGPRRLALALDQSTLETSSAPRTSFSSASQLDFTRKLTLDTVDQLTVEKSLVTIISKSFAGKTDQKEKWYGTDFSVEPIPVSVLDQWRNPASPKKLGLDFPKPNVFIPSEAGLVVKNPPILSDKLRKRSFEDRLTPVPPPELIRDDGPGGRWQVYYKPDNRFGQPKAFLIFELLNQEVYSSAKNAALSNIFEFSIGERLNEYAYDAGLAGLSYNVQVVPRGVRVTFGGYNDKLQKFASYVTAKISTNIRDILPDKKEFERFKDIISRGLAAFDVKQPYAHCAAYTNLAMQPEKFLYSNDELRKANDEATLEDLISFTNSVWSSGNGLALLQGNIDQGEALSIVNTVDRALRFKASSPEDYPPELSPLPFPPIKKKTVPTKIKASEPNPSNGNAAVQVVLQNLSEEPKDHVLLELLSAIVSEPFYEDLRTKQQLGYIVSSGIRAVGKTRFMAFIVQSSVAPTDKLTTETLKYLDKVRPSLLEKLNKGDFAVYVKSLIDRKTEPDKELSQEVTRNWAEIGSGRLQFDRVQREVAALLDLQKEDLLKFWDNLYVEDGRRVLITEVVPQVGSASSAAPPLSFGYSNVYPDDDKGLVLGLDDLEKYRKDRAMITSTSIDLARIS